MLKIDIHINLLYQKKPSDSTAFDINSFHIFVEASSIGDTFPLKRAVKGRCGDFRSKAKKILPDLDCGSLSV